MRPPTRARLALALALSLSAVARGQDDAGAPAADPDQAEGSGSTWACFAVAVAAIGGLYVVVRRRERAAEAERRDRGPETVWYCRACDRDVSGPTCPHCRAVNPFRHEPADVGAGADRLAARPRDSGRRGPRRQHPIRRGDPGGAADPGD